MPDMYFHNVTGVSIGPIEALQTGSVSRAVMVTTRDAGGNTSDHRLVLFADLPSAIRVTAKEDC